MHNILKSIFKICEDASVIEKMEISQHISVSINLVNMFRGYYLYVHGATAACALWKTEGIDRCILPNVVT